MERNQTYYNYIEFIFGYFSKMGCHVGQGGYILRGLDSRAREAGYNLNAKFMYPYCNA